MYSQAGGAQGNLLVQVCVCGRIGGVCEGFLTGRAVPAGVAGLSSSPGSRSPFTSSRLCHRAVLYCLFVLLAGSTAS